MKRLFRGLRWALVTVALVAIQLPARAANFDIIAGFETEWTASGALRFCPTCRDREGTGVHPCSPSELNCFFFEWQFSETDFSTQAKPERILASGPIRVVMRYTGIKEERVGHCLVPSFTSPECITHTAMAPSDWWTDERERWITSAAGASGPIVASEYFQSFFTSASGPSAAIGKAHGIPIWGSEMVYPVVIYNPTDDEMQFRVKLTNALEKISSGREMLPIEPTILYGSSPLHISPMGDALLVCGTLSAQSSVVFLAKAKLPADKEGWSADSHFVELADYWDPNSDACPCNQGLGQQDSLSAVSCYSSLKATRQDTISSTIDPNHKKVEGRRAYYLAGDWVEFSIHFTNVGNLAERLVYVADRFDPRFDASTATFLSCTIFKSGREARGRRVMVSEERVIENHGDHLFWMEFRDDRYVLEPGDSGVAHIRVQLRSSEGATDSWWLPSGLSTHDTTYTEIPNTAYTMFGMEGVTYAAKCTPGPILVQVVAQPNMLFWVLLILVLMFIVVVVWVVVRRRRILPARPEIALGSVSAQPR